MQIYSIYKKLLSIRELIEYEVEYSVQLREILKIYHGDFKSMYLVGSMFNRLIIGRTNQYVTVLPLYKGMIIDHFKANYSNELIPIESDHEEVFQFLIIDEAEFVKKMSSPKVHLIVLYHKENFPLPRFALGISDIASSLRDGMLGTVELFDMQLQETLDSLGMNIDENRPDIVGISVTFGQQDLLEALIERIHSIPNYNPLIVTGGSLSALNAELLLEKYPDLIVGLGYGETTMKQIVEYWYGKRPIFDVNHIAYRLNGVTHTTPKTIDDKKILVLPELDLLPRTFSLNGVLQLESSRGCTYACSFCPRGHKGRWSGNIGGELSDILPTLKQIYAKFPQISKKIFLVDEEFIGYGTNVAERALNIAKELSENGFKFESSTRIDQVYVPNKSKEWHLERLEFWKGLKNYGLSRMLFGVESGVDSILLRFNKKTTSFQNIAALRMLTSLKIPIRISYITFDPLMTMEELMESYEFQGRRDIILNPISDDLTEEIYNTAISDIDAIQNSSGKPLYTQISYMLVSMESLMNSKYLELVNDSELALDEDLSMGRVRTKYRDPMIGIMSELSQRWVDRNFALDYLLKSLIKITDDSATEGLYKMREVIKESAYILLGKMLSVVLNDMQFVRPYLTDEKINHLNDLKGDTVFDEVTIHLKEVLLNVMEDHFSEITIEMGEYFRTMLHLISPEINELLSIQLNTWKERQSWELINGERKDEIN